MKSFIIISSLVYSLSFSLPPSGIDHMSLYETSEVENRLGSEFDGNTVVQKELMSFYVEPDRYRMTTSGEGVISTTNHAEQGSGELEVFGVKIEPLHRE